MKGAIIAHCSVEPLQYSGVLSTHSKTSIRPCEKLARHGSTTVSEPGLLDIKAIPGKGQREMTFLGPDGEMFNLMEMDPKEAFEGSTLPSAQQD
jgi:hypothetical protein